MATDARPEGVRRTRDRILIINGHPDARAERFCSALAAAYVLGAQEAGRDVRRLDVAQLSFPLLGGGEDQPTPSPDIAAAQNALRWADHLVLIFPLWLGGPPALLKGFMEQVFRYGVALSKPAGRGLPQGLLKGRSARLIVTMGMPGLVYRLMFGGFAARAVESGILGLSGIGPCLRTLIGGMGEADPARNRRWLATVQAMGRDGV